MSEQLTPGPRIETPHRRTAPLGTVLVVEDDADTRDTIVELLAEHGYQVAAVANGRQAETYLRDNRPPDCLVLDLWMPEMNGWTLAMLMKRGRLPQIPTIVVTAADPHWGSPSPLVLPKPLDSTKLLALVAKTVRPASDNGD
jgi:DNA-binding NtrC family response regulator